MVRISDIIVDLEVIGPKKTNRNKRISEDKNPHYSIPSALITPSTNHQNENVARKRDKNYVAETNLENDVFSSQNQLGESSTRPSLREELDTVAPSNPILDLINIPKDEFKPSDPNFVEKFKKNVKSLAKKVIHLN